MSCFGTVWGSRRPSKLEPEVGGGLHAALLSLWNFLLKAGRLEEAGELFMRRLTIHKGTSSARRIY